LLNHLILVHLLLVQVLGLVVNWLGGMLHDYLTHLSLAHGKAGRVLLLLGNGIEVILLHLLVNKLLLVGSSLQVFLVVFCFKARQPCIALLWELEPLLLRVELLLFVVLTHLVDSLQMLSCSLLSVVLRHDEILLMRWNQLG
jgi:hypothetical protein